MKPHSKILYKGIKGFLAILMVTFLSTIVFAEKKNNADLHSRIPELDDMDFTEMINSVNVREKTALIQKFQDKEARDRLLKEYKNKPGCSVESYRNKEVLLITIPAKYLFAPNSIELSPDASKFLIPIKRYLKDPDMYRVLLAMHTDNTGSKEYREEITVDRVNAVFDWFEDNTPDTRYLFSYALSDEMPLAENNNSMENRDMNRRLEIFLVPGKKMLEQAQKGRIAF